MKVLDLHLSLMAFEFLLIEIEIQTFGQLTRGCLSLNQAVRFTVCISPAVCGPAGDAEVFVYPSTKAAILVANVVSCSRRSQSGAKPIEQRASFQLRGLLVFLPCGLECALQLLLGEHLWSGLGWIGRSNAFFVSSLPRDNDVGSLTAAPRSLCRFRHHTDECRVEFVQPECSFCLHLLRAICAATSFSIARPLAVDVLRQHAIFVPEAEQLETNVEVLHHGNPVKPDIMTAKHINVIAQYCQGSGHLHQRFGDPIRTASLQQADMDVLI